MEAVAVGSRIDRVTVYRQGAQVTRVAEIAAAEGRLPGAVRLGGLPLALDDGSLSVRVIGAGELPVATDVRVALEVPEVDQNLPAADPDDLEAARAEVARLERDIATAQRQLGRLDKLQIAARPEPAEGQPPGDSPTAARLALIEFRAGREQALRERLHRARRDLERAERRLELAEDRDRRASSARQAREHELRKSVEITLQGDASSAEPVTLELEYQVAGARWSPAYSVHLEPDMAAARLAMRALIGQRTGEDWNGVRLTLSTADAQRWTELPELDSRRIGRRQPRPARPGWRPPPTGAEALYADYDRAFAARRAPEPPPPVTETVADLDEWQEDQPAEETVTFAVDGVMLGAPLEAEDEELAMPPPGAAPMAGGPVPDLEMMQVESRRGGLGGLLSRVAAPAKSERKKRMAPGRPVARASALAPAAAGQAIGHGAGGAPVEAEPELVAADELLAYGKLRMPPPDAAERGRLILASRQELLLSLLVRQEIRVEFDVLGAIAAARTRARALESAPLPPGCHPVWSEEYDYAYRADDPIDVPSDGEPHSIPLGVLDATARPLYIVVPRHSTDVFRSVEVDNPFDAPLLRGPIDVYWGGDFLLTSAVDFTVPRAPVELGLGVEQAIKVSRNTRYREETAGLIGGSLDLEHQILIEAVSHLPRPVALEVRERVPVLRDDEEEIKLEVKKVSPPWQRFDPFPDRADAPELRGGHRWRIELRPGAKQELRVDYEIRISAKHELVGGNRREV